MATWAELNKSAGGQSTSAVPSASQTGGWAAANSKAIEQIGGFRYPGDTQQTPSIQTTAPNGIDLVPGSSISAPPASNKKFQILGVTINKPTSISGTASGQPIISVDKNKFQAKASENSSFIQKGLAATVNAVGQGILGVSQSLGNLFDVMLVDTQAKKEQAKGIDSANSSLPELRQRVEQGKSAIPTASEKVGAVLDVGTSIANLAFTPVSAQLSAAEELPVIGKPVFGTINKGFELLDHASRFVGTKVVDVLPIDDQSKAVLRQPIEDLAGIVGTLFGVKAIHTIGADGGGRVIDALPVSESSKGQIRGGIQLGAGVALEPFSVAYRGIIGTVRTKIEARQAKGELITPEVAQNVVNETVKEVKTPEIQAVMEVPTTNGKTRIYTNQKLVLENLVRGKEDLNYKRVNDLGVSLKNGDTITSRFEWDYAKQQGTIYTTDKTTAVDLAHELGHYIDRQLGAALSLRLSDVLPDYVTNRDQINQMLADYALDRLGGDATYPEINAEIVKIAENIRSELQANADRTERARPAQEFARSVGDIINDPLKRKASPELAQLIDFSIGTEASRKGGKADITGSPGSETEAKSILNTLTKAQREAIKATREGNADFQQQRLMEEMKRQGILDKGEQASANFDWQKISKALRDSAEFKKEGTITDRTIDGVLMEKNGKFRVVPISDVKKMQRQGWESRFSMDEIAHANGFENAEDYSYYIMELDADLRAIGRSSEQRAAHEYLLKNDPNYAKLTNQIETIREQLTSAEATVRTEKSGSTENARPVPTEQKTKETNPEISALNIVKQKNIDLVNKTTQGSQLQARLKAIGFEFAAFKRALTGEPTGKEIQNARKKLESNFVGKQVEILSLGESGEVKGTAFGRIRVKLKNGEIKSVEVSDIRNQTVTDAEVMAYIKDQAMKTLENGVYGDEFKKALNESPNEQKVAGETKKTIEIVKKERKTEVNIEKAGSEPIQRPTGKGTSKIGESIARKAIEQKLEDSYKGTAEYEKINIKDQAERVQKLINSDLEQAKRIMTGEEALPDGMRVLAFIKGMEEYALKSGDPEIAFELANSPLISETSLFAQEMRLARERSPDSATARLQEVKKARLAEAQKLLRRGETVEGNTKKALGELRDEVKKSRPKKEDWSSFIESIKC